MPNFFTLKDGNLFDNDVLYPSLANVDYTASTTGTMLSSNGLLSIPYFSLTNTITALALNLSARSANPVGTVSLVFEGRTDSSIYYSPNHTLNPVGVYQSSFSPFRPEGWSAYFDTTNYLPAPRINFSNQPFTIEGWFKPVSAISGSNMNFWGESNAIGNNPKILLTISTGTDSLTLSTGSLAGTVLSATNASTKVPVNTWTHVCLVREGLGTNQTKLYLNGVVAASGTLNANLSSITQPFNIGYIGEAAGNKFNGLVSNFRVLTASALYTDNFTPSTTPLTNISNTALLTLQSNSINKDNSNYNNYLTPNGTPQIRAVSPFTPAIPFSRELHGGSISLRGADFTRLNTLSAPNFNSITNFTVEGWIYLRSGPIPGHQGWIINVRNGNSTQGDIQWDLNISQNFRPSFTYWNVSTAYQIIGPTALSFYTWYHIAATKIGATTYLFINGVLVANTTHATATMNSWTNGVYSIGNPWTAASTSETFDGYVSNFRVICGDGLYTNTFTPSSSPLTNITNTNLLINGSVGDILSSSFTETYPISGFTQYEGTSLSDFSPTQSQNWQLLKLSQLLYSNLAYTIGLSTSNPNQLTLVGTPTTVNDGSTYNKPSFTGTITTSLCAPTNYKDSYYIREASFISYPANGSFNFDGDFTWELWINNTVFTVDGAGGSRRILSFGTNAGNNLQLILGTSTQNTNVVSLYTNGAVVEGTIAISDGNWHHVAVSRVGSILKLFVDGVQSGSTYNAFVVYNAGVGTSLSIGTYGGSTTSGRLSGAYISDLRMIKGVGLYTSNFTVPSGGPLQRVDNAENIVLLKSSGVNFNKYLITDNNNSLPSIGALTVSNTSLSSGSPFGTGVDGSIQFLSASSSTITPPIPLIPATDTFTIEGWFYTKSLGADQSIYSQYLNPGTANRFCFNIEGASSKLVWAHAGTVGGSSYYSTTVIQTNRWYHFAVSKDYSNTLRIFVDGKLEAINSNYTTPFSLSNPKFGTFNGANFLNGYITNIRASLVPLYTSNFDVPTEPLKAIRGTTFLLNSTSYSGNAYYYTTNDFVHIGGALKGSTTEYRTITADSAVLYNLYIHNNGTLTFPSISSKTLTFIGTSGLQITSDGTLNIGTSSELVPSNITHTVILSNTQINVHNGGNLNVYGSYKLPYTYLLNDSTAFSRTFTTTDSVSTSWLSDDRIVFTPNLLSRTTADILTLSSFNSDNVFTTTTSAAYFHNSISALPYVPAVSNISRNVTLRGYLSSQRGNIRSIDASKVNINNTQFSHFGFNRAGYRGLVFNPNANGSVVLSGCAIEVNSFNGAEMNNFTGAAGIWITNQKPYAHNIKIDNNFIGITIDTNNNTLLASVSADNFIYTNNLMTGGGGQGGSLTFDSVTGKNVLVKDNYVIASGTNGTKVNLCNLSGSFGVTNYLSLSQGLQINLNASSTSPTFSSIKCTYNSGGGIYVDASSVGSNTNSLTFDSISSISNIGSNIILAGNNLNYFTPFNINISNYYANGSSQKALNASNIVGILSNWYIINNTDGVFTSSIGNGKTIISNLTSINNSYVVYNTNNLMYINGSVAYVTSNPFNNSVDGSSYYSTSNGAYVINSVNLGTSDFTIESWIYCLGYNAVNTLFTFGTWNIANPGYGIILRIRNGDGFYINNGSVGDWSGGSTYTNVPLNTWHHVALVRRGLNLNVYVNGVSKLSSTTATIYNLGTQDVWIGNSKHQQTELFNGYISNFRISTSAVYTQNFNLSAPISPRTPLGWLPSTQYLFRGNQYRVRSSNYNYYDMILSGINYNETIVNNFVPDIGSNGILLDSTKFEHFVLQNSNLSNSLIPLSAKSTNNVLEGSYGFHNNTFEVSSVSASLLNNYQSDTYTETGFAFMRHNQLGDNHFKISKAGKISFDRSVYNAPNNLSEKLEPTSSTNKLRSTKLIPINTGDQYTISVTIKKSSNYTGAAPRLVLKHNGSLGYNQDVVLATSILGNNIWETLMGSLPSASLDNGMIEVYVDCSGNSGSGYINIDSWRFL